MSPSPFISVVYDDLLKLFNVAGLLFFFLQSRRLDASTRVLVFAPLTVAYVTESASRI